MESAREEQILFNARRRFLGSELGGFVDDFGTWSPGDRSKFVITGRDFSVDGLEHKAAPYGRNMIFWVNFRASTDTTREAFLGCLEYLKRGDGK